MRCRILICFWVGLFKLGCGGVQCLAIRQTLSVLCLSVSVFLSLFSHASTSQFVLIKVFVFYKACMICPLQNNIDSRTDSYLFACCIPVTFNTLDGTEFCKKGHIMASIEYCLYQFTTAIWLLTISNLVMRSLLELYTMLTSFITPFLSKITLPQSCGK